MLHDLYRFLKYTSFWDYSLWSQNISNEVLQYNSPGNHLQQLFSITCEVSIICSHTFLPPLICLVRFSKLFHSLFHLCLECVSFCAVTWEYIFFLVGFPIFFKHSPQETKVSEWSRNWMIFNMAGNLCWDNAKVIKAGDFIGFCKWIFKTKFVISPLECCILLCILKQVS